MHIVFKFNCGFGNRLCNLMNLFYIHEIYPDALIYINWILNNHCNIPVDDIFDFTSYPFIRPAEEYYNHIFPSHRNIELWASTSVNERTRWDNIDEWSKHKCIISVSYNMYSFVTPEYCRNIFRRLIFRDSITARIADKIAQYGTEKKLIHFRNGDLVKIISENESTDKVNCLLAKVKQLPPEFTIFEYDQMTVDRNHNHMLESIADLLFLSQHSNFAGYCPYSHFSSWVFLLSAKFIDDKEKYPIFNCKKIDVILLDS